MKRGITGISLAELLVVVGLLAATGAFGAYFISYHKPTLELRTASYELRARLQRARTLALTEQVDYGIRFAPERNTYTLVQLAPTFRELELFTLSESISFSAITPFDDNTVRFNSAGAAAAGGSMTLKNSKDALRTVSVFPSGFIRTD